jgi:hypothetical protein
MKKIQQKELHLEPVYVIRENGKWVALIAHSGLGLNLKTEDKDKEVALMKLCKILYEREETHPMRVMGRDEQCAYILENGFTTKYT